MSRDHRDDWLRDVEARQRNIVFPDTTQNAGRFWRTLYSDRHPLNGAQWAGIIIMFVLEALALVGLLGMLWPSYEGPWWQKLIDGYAIPSILFTAMVLFVVWGNRKVSRSSQSHHKPD